MTAKQPKFSLGQRVRFQGRLNDIGTVKRLEVSQWSPTDKSREAEPLEIPAPWYFVEWDQTAIPGVPDPEVWWRDQDLA